MSHQCSVCSEECIAMCPFCKAYVCPSAYGLYRNCGNTHEMTCEGARKTREVVKKVEQKPDDGKFDLAEAEELAERLKLRLAPFCKRIEIAGSIRRKVKRVGDIEVVAIPKFEKVQDIFGPVDESTANRLWENLDHIVYARDDVEYVKAGEKYRQLIVKMKGNRKIKVDLFTCEPGNWGWIFLVRTGSADFSHGMASKLNRKGYTSREGWIRKIDSVRTSLDTPDEESVFKLVGESFVSPEKRDWK